MRIATHAALKVIRKRRGLDTVSLEAAAESIGEGERIPHPEFIADWREAPHELIARGETRQLLDEALNRLDDKHRGCSCCATSRGFRSRKPPRHSI